MKKQLVILGIVAILVTVGLSGCSNQVEDTVIPEEAIIGTWKRTNFIMENQTWEFRQNGTFAITGVNLPIAYYHFNNSNNTLEIFYSGMGLLDVYEYRFNGSDNLYLTLQPSINTVDPSTGQKIEFEEWLFQRVKESLL
jgi:uncharacterized protein YceK